MRGRRMAEDRRTGQLELLGHPTRPPKDAHLALNDQVDENELAMRLDLQR